MIYEPQAQDIEELLLDWKNSSSPRMLWGELVSTHKYRSSKVFSRHLPSPRKICQTACGSTLFHSRLNSSDVTQYSNSVEGNQVLDAATKRNFSLQTPEVASLSTKFDGHIHG